MGIDRAGDEPEADSVPIGRLVMNAPAHQEVNVAFRSHAVSTQLGIDMWAERSWMHGASGSQPVLLWAPSTLIALNMFSNRSTSRGLNRKRAPKGPILLLGRILTTWRLGELEAARLLGLDPSDGTYMADVLAGRKALRGRDANDRLAYLIQMRMALFGWLRDEAAENEWLREAHAALDGQVPMELLLAGSMENMLLVKEYVEAATGW